MADIQMSTLQDYFQDSRGPGAFGKAVAPSTIKLQPRSDSLRGIPGLAENQNMKSQPPLSLVKPSKLDIPAISMLTINPHTLPSASSSAVQPSLPIQAHFRSQAGSISATDGQNLSLQNLSATGISSNPQSTLEGAVKSSGNPIPMPTGEHVLLGVNRGYHLHLAQIDRSGCPDDMHFFAKLKKEYNTKRGIIRRWLGVKQFHHCEFVEVSF
jgi:hypothetical protein